LPATALVSCTEEKAPPATYEDGYRFGKEEGPAAHLGGAGPEDTDAADSECGEHAESDGVTTSPEWDAGCVDGALGLPERTGSSTPSTPRDAFTHQ
jgi:hypothetical protein